MIFRIFHCTWCNDNFNVTNFLQNFLSPSQRWNFPLEKSRRELIRRDIFGSQHNFCINDSLNQKKKKKKRFHYSSYVVCFSPNISRMFFAVFSRERERERERARFFNQKPDAVVFLLKGAMKFVYQSLRLPFSHSHAHVFLSSKNFSKNFFPPLGLPLRNFSWREPDFCSRETLECETLCFARENSEIRGPSFTKLCLFREY